VEPLVPDFMLAWRGASSTRREAMINPHFYTSEGKNHRGQIRFRARGTFPAEFGTQISNGSCAFGFVRPSDF
jgi:hypothetical protein